MNTTSLLFATLIVALIGATAWFIDWGAKTHGDWSDRKRGVVRILMLGAAIAAGAFVYLTDFEQRGTTLFEEVAPWGDLGGRVSAVVVEHPGVEHRLIVYPHAKGLQHAGRPVTLRTRLVQDGQLLIDETTTHKTTRRSRGGGTTWREETFRFTPQGAGALELRIDAIGSPPHRLHLRIEDPEKRDGVRAPGY